MKAIPFTFTGNCFACGEHQEDGGGVAVCLDEDDEDVFDGTWLCLKCARRAARRIIKAMRACEDKLAAGLVFRHELWTLNPTAEARSYAEKAMPEPIHYWPMGADETACGETAEPRTTGPEEVTCERCIDAMQERDPNDDREDPRVVGYP